MTLKTDLNAGGKRHARSRFRPARPRPTDRVPARDVEAELAQLERVIDGKTLVTEFARTVERHGDRDALRWKGEHGWETLTWHEYRDQVRDLSLGLGAVGLDRGGFAVLMTRNRPQHLIASQAVMHAGGTMVSLYDELAPAQVAYIAQHSDAAVAVVEEAFLDLFLGLRDELRNLQSVVVIGDGDRALADGWLVGWDEALALGRTKQEQHPTAFETRARAVRPDDLAALIYTSGTTGPPKGAMISHRLALAEVESLAQTFRANDEDRFLSYLPLAHSTSQHFALWQGTVAATTTHFSDDPAELVPSLLEVRPTWFMGPPRIWERLESSIKASPVAHLGAGAVGLDECRVPIVAGAPCPPETIEFFHSIGIPLADGWGMTELGFGLWNPPIPVTRGAIRQAAPGLDVRIAVDGELLVRRPRLIAGYYNDPGRTAELFDDDGWFHTGDIALRSDDGHVRIVDRKKELIVTAFGKNISPTNLEALLEEHELIGQACVVGDGREYIAALIVLDPRPASAFARQRELQPGSFAALAGRPEVAAEIESHVAAVNTRLSRAEQIARFAVVPSQWTVASGELTPTFKLKRRVIADRHAAEIDALYS